MLLQTKSPLFLKGTKRGDFWIVYLLLKVLQPQRAGTTPELQQNHHKWSASLPAMLDMAHR